jgi:hypothetical protein
MKVDWGKNLIARSYNKSFKAETLFKDFIFSNCVAGKAKFFV